MAWELTSPVNVTTPFFTSYLTSLLSLFWMRAASRFFSTPFSKSELTVLASLSAAGGITPIWFDTTCPPAMDLAMDSACDLSPSDGTCPPRVTTPLSRSWLTDTSWSPAWSSDLRMLSETSGDFVVPEHPARVPTIKSVSNVTCNLTVFMLLLLWVMGLRYLKRLPPAPSGAVHTIFPGLSSLGRFSFGPSRLFFRQYRSEEHTS